MACALGHVESVTVEMWLTTVAAYVCCVCTASWLRAVKWCVTGRVVDGELLNVRFWSPMQSIA